MRFLLSACVLLIAAAIFAEDRVQILEMPDTSADRIIFEAAIPYPESDLWHQGHWEMLAQSLRQGSQDFGRQELRRLTQLTGTNFVTQANDGWMRVQLSVPAGEMDLGALLMTSILFRPSLREDDFRLLLSTLDDATPRSPWEQAVGSRRAARWRPHFEEFRLLYETAFVPDQMVFGVAGSFRSGEGQAAIASRLPRRQAPRTDGLRRTPQPPLAPPTEPSAFRFVERIFPEVQLDGAGGPQQLLAAYVLGAGFSSHLTSALRERRGLSYRQEFLLVPTLAGYRPTLRAATDADQIEADAWERVREAVLADLAELSDADVERARTLLLQSFDVAMPYHPLMLDAERLVSPALEDQIALRVYWTLTGMTLTPEQLRPLVENVELEDVLEQIERWFKPSSRSNHNLLTWLRGQSS